MGTRSRQSRKSRDIKTGKSGRSAPDRLNYAGLSIEIPPELDLPAGAPFHDPEPPPPVPDDIQALLKPLAAIATNTWRARSRMIDPATGEPHEEMRRVSRFVDAIQSALEDAGVRVLDPAGRAYDSGMALKVLSFEAVPGLGREEIIETIRPSVIWRDRLLQMGEVIVGTVQPLEHTEAAPGEAAGASDNAAARPENAFSNASCIGEKGEEAIVAETAGPPDMVAVEGELPSKSRTDGDGEVRQAGVSHLSHDSAASEEAVEAAEAPPIDRHVPDTRPAFNPDRIAGTELEGADDEQNDH